jgi:hypothetical protein
VSTGGTTTPTAAPSFDPAESFILVGTGCSDGWSSPSIGRRGACSHHGGVVTVYRGDRGDELSCRSGSRPPYGAARQSEQRAEFGRLFCTSGY